MSNPSHDLITLKGLIVPAQWDKKGNITGIAISCFDEDEYQVLMDETGGGLKDFLHQKVEIVGQPTKRKRSKGIKVKAFNINGWNDFSQWPKIIQPRLGMTHLGIPADRGKETKKTRPFKRHRIRSS